MARKSSQLSSFSPPDYSIVTLIITIKSNLLILASSPVAFVRLLCCVAQYAATHTTAGARLMTVVGDSGIVKEHHQNHTFYNAVSFSGNATV